MAQTIKEQIMQRIAATLAAVGGIKSVQRLSQAGVSLATVPAVIVTQGDDLLEDRQVSPYTTRRLEFVASIVTRQTDAADLRSGDEILNGLGADVEAAILADRTVGGLAEDIKPPEWLEVAIEHQVPHIGIALRFAVMYRHLRQDPYLN